MLDEFKFRSKKEKKPCNPALFSWKLGDLLHTEHWTSSQLYLPSLFLASEEPRICNIHRNPPPVVTAACDLQVIYGRFMVGATAKPHICHLLMPTHLPLSISRGAIMPLLLFHLPNLMQASLLSRTESQANLARSSEKCGPQDLAPLIKRRTEKEMEINVDYKNTSAVF